MRYYVVLKVDGASVQHPGGFRTHAEARAVNDRLVQAKRRGKDVRPRAETVSDALDTWMSAKASADRHGTRTQERYAQIVRDFLKPVIGGVRLDRVTSDEVQEVIDSMREREVAPASIEKAYRVLTSALRHAVARGRLEALPVGGVERPEIRRAELRIPSASEVSKILKASADHPLGLAYLIAAHTGLRRSEVVGLRWSDLDLGARELRVRRAATFSGRTVTMKDYGKSDRARRVVRFGESVTTGLKAHRAEQSERRLAIGPGWRDGDLVLDNGDGSPVHPERVTRYFVRLTERLGISVRLHDLRHFAISTWLRAGVPVLVASRMAGHAKASFTMDTYGHCIPEDQTAAVAAMDAALGGPS